MQIPRPVQYLVRIHGAVRPGGRMTSSMVAQHMVGKEYVRAMVPFLTKDLLSDDVADRVTDSLHASVVRDEAMNRRLLRCGQ